MKYQPLDKKKNEIRVLRFLDVPGPVFREGLIQCCIENVSLDCSATYLGLSKNHSQPGTFRYPWGDFEALSYTWSQEGDIREILINGNRREVSKNLEGALRALRELKETHSGMRYWVDSLCIDQGNIWERNEQVKRMREIYSKARAVIVWLGQEEGTDRNAVQTMRHLCRNPCVEEPLWLPGNLQLEGWYALCAFMQKPYWNRSWIIQEL
ncbi:HET-domain-containing protein, partial [Corynespora cassiicola Philippines]